MVSRRNTKPPAVLFHCLFCGSALKTGTRRDRFTCPRCHAVFLAGRNARGCVRQMAVDTCGATPCCRDLDGAAMHGECAKDRPCHTPRRSR